MSAGTKIDTMTTMRYVLAAALVAMAFFVSYSLAAALSGTSVDSDGLPAAGLAQEGFGAGGVNCACCANTGTGEITEGEATVDGDVQRIAVDASAGYRPNVIRAKAGVPLEVAFSEGYGCMAQVISPELGFSEDLTSGPKVVVLPALEPGEYGFSCGMEMVFGTIIVE